MLSLPERLKSPLLLSVLVIILLGLVIPGIVSSKKFPIPNINFEQIEYPSSTWKDRVLKNVNAASVERDVGERYEIYNRIFTDLLAIYTTNHGRETRSQVEIVAQFVASQFPKLYRPQDFVVPCLDLDCASANYPDQIEEIKDGLKSLKDLDLEVAESVLKKFEAGALSGDSDHQWQNYYNAFQELVGEKKRTNSEEIGKLTQTLRDFLKSNYAEYYSSLEKALPESFEV